MSNLLTTRGKTSREGVPSKQDLALEFLRKHQVGVIATASSDGLPHASVIYYAVDALLNITFITKRRTRKGENLRMNNQAELVVHDEKTQTMVEVSGKAFELTDAEEASQAFRNALRASLHTADSAIPPISKLAAGDYVAYRLRSTQVRMAVYNQRSSRIGNRLFETINK